MEEVKVKIGIDDQGFATGLKRDIGQMEQLSATAKKSGMSIDDMGRHVKQLGRDIDEAADKGTAGFGRLEKAAVAFFSIQKAKEFVGKVYEVRSEIEKLETSFRVLVGNKDKADALLASIRKFAVETPMQLKDLAGAAQTMMGFGIATEDVMENLKALGNVAMGDREKFQSLALAFSQMSATGRLMGQDFLQMVNAGFNPLDQMAKTTGKSVAVLKKEMSEGSISADMVRQAFIDATGEGGKFNGMLEAQSKTMAGDYASLQGAIDDMLNDIGQKSEGIMSGSIEVATSLAQNYETVGKVLAGLISTYGVYKAAVMVVTALETFRTRNLALQAVGISGVSAAEAIHYGWLVLVQKAQALLNATMLANPYVAVATAVAALVAVMVTMKSQQDLVNEAQEEYNRKKEETIAKEKEHADKLNELISIAGNESLSTDTRREAMLKLKAEYPDLFKKYNTEIEALKDIACWKAKIAEIESGKSITLAKNELEDVNRQIAELEAKAKATYEAYMRLTPQARRYASPSFTREEAAKLTQLRNRRDELNKEQKKASDAAYLKDLTGVSNEELQRQISERRDLIARIEMQEREGKKNVKGRVVQGGVTGLYNKAELQDQLQTMEWEQNRRKQLLDDQSKDFVKEATKAYNAERAALQKLESLTDPDKRAKSKLKIDGKKVSDMGADEFLAAIEKQQKAVDDAKKKVDAYNKARNGGSSSTSKEDAAAKRDAASREKQFEQDLSERQRQAKQRQDMEDAIADAAIANEQNRARRELMQMEKDHKDALAAIDRQAEEMRKANYEAQKKAWEAANTDKTKVWSDTDTAKDVAANGFANIKLTEEQLATLKALRDKENADYARSVKERYDELIASHVSYVSKKKALDKKYKEDIALIDEAIKEAEKKGQAEQLEQLKATRAEALKDYAKEQTNLSFDQLKASPEYIRAFEDMKSVSKETLEYLIGEFEKVKESAARNLSPTEYREVTKAIREMRNELNADNPFKRLADSAKELKDAISGRDGVRAALEEARKLLKAVENGEKIRVPSFDKDTGRTTSMYLTKVQAIQRVNDAEAKLREAEDDVADAANKQNELFSVSISKYNELANSIGQLGGQLDGFAGKMLKMSSDVISFATNSLDAFNKLKTGIITGMSAIEKASLVLNVMSTGLQLFNAISSIFGGDDDAEAEREHSELIQKLDKRLSVTNDRISELNETLSSEFGTGVIVAAEQLREQQKLLQQQLAEVIKAEQKYKFEESIIGMMGNPELAFATGVLGDRYGLEGAGKFTSLTKLLNENDINDVAEALARLRKEDQFTWSELISNAGDYSKYIEQLADTWDNIADSHVKERDRILGTTLDQLVEGMLSSLYDLADGAEDVTESVADNFQKMMNRMIVDAVVGETLREKLLIYANQWKKAYENDKQIDKDERKSLNDMYMDIYHEYALMINELREQGKTVATENLTEYFANLSDSWSSTLMEMEDDAEQWKRDILRVMFERLVNEQVIEAPVNVEFGSVKTEFHNLEVYINDWMMRYNEVMNDVTFSDEERTRRLKELADEQAAVREGLLKKTEGIAESIGYSKEFSNALDNLKDTFVDTLLDMDNNAGRIGTEIGMTLVKEMIAEMLASEKYKDAMERIRKIWQNVLKSDNGEWEDENGVVYTLQTVIGLINDLNEEIANDNDIASLTKAYQKFKEAADFSSLTDDYTSALTDMESSSEDWGERIGKVLAGKIIEQAVSAKPIIERITKAYNDAVALYTNEEGVVDWIGLAGDESLKQAIEESKNEFKDAQAVVESINAAFGILRQGVGDLDSALVSALTDTNTTAETFGAQIGKTVAEQMLNSYVANSPAWKTRIDELNAQWAHAVEDNDTEAMERIRKALMELYSDMGSDETVQKLTADINALNDAVDDSARKFDRLHDTIVSAFTDGKDAVDEILREISSQLAKDLINKNVMNIPLSVTYGEDTYFFERGYDEYLEQWEQWYDNILTAENISEEERQQLLQGLIDQMAGQIDILAEGAEAVEKAFQHIVSDTTFSDMGDDWVSALMDMDSTASDFGRQIGQTLVSKLVKELIVTKQLQKYLDDVQKAYDEAIGKEGATVESVLAAVTPAINAAVAATEKWKPVIEEVAERFQDLDNSTPLDNIRSSFLSQMMDMKSDTKDFARSINEILTEAFIDKFVLGEEFGKRLEEWQEQYASIMGGNYSEEERAKLLKHLRQAIVTAKEGYAAEAEAIHDLMGTANYADQSATMNLSDKATYEQMDQYLGVQMGIYMVTEQILTTLRGGTTIDIPAVTLSSFSMATETTAKQILSAIQTMKAATNPDSSTILEMRNMMATGNEYLLDIKRSNREILSQFGSKLDSINGKLAKL